MGAQVSIIELNELFSQGNIYHVSFKVFQKKTFFELAVYGLKYFIILNLWRDYTTFETNLLLPCIMP